VSGCQSAIIGSNVPKPVAGTRACASEAPGATSLLGVGGPAQAITHMAFAGRTLAVRMVGRECLCRLTATVLNGCVAVSWAGWGREPNATYIGALPCAFGRSCPNIGAVARPTCVCVPSPVRPSFCVGCCNRYVHVVIWKSRIDGRRPSWFGY
jgi:hypothetical protein